MNEEYALTHHDAVRAVKVHFKAVTDKLPSKPIHEVPYEEIIRIAGQTLGDHTDFRTAQSNVLVPIQRGKPIYSKFELAHKILTERVLSQLRAERLVQRKHLPLLRKALGELYARVPPEVRKEQLAAFNLLEKKMGPDDTNELVKRAGELWQTHAKQYEKAREAMSDEMKRLRLPPEMFGNPTNHIVLTFATNAAEVRERLELLKTDKLNLKQGYQLAAA